jgi:very-long-chain enoyl-CoA reductase
MNPNAIQGISSNLKPLEMIPGIKGAAITSFQVLATLTSYFLESNPKTTAQYSKFANRKKTSSSSKQAWMIPSRLGMTLIYAPAFIVSTVMMTYYYFHSAMSSSLVIPLATVFLVIHFTKRLLETYFVHVYSGSVSFNLSMGIGMYYAMVTLLISTVAAKGGGGVADLLSGQTVEIPTMVGSLLFVIGSLGNLYHHVLLSSLRQKPNKSNLASKRMTTSKQTSIYVAPKGGWFQYVAAPHYLFELVAWLGIAMVAQHLNAYLVFTNMCSYLAGRSVSQNQWNRHQFGDEDEDWPKNRKNLVPFVF